MPIVRLKDKPDFTLNVAEGSPIISDPRYELVGAEPVKTTQQATQSPTPVYSSSGQLISEKDPNYSVFKAQQESRGVAGQPTTQPKQELSKQQITDQLRQETGLQLQTSKYGDILMLSPTGVLSEVGPAYAKEMLAQGYKYADTSGKELMPVNNIQSKMTGFINYAKDKGFQINEQTGEVIDPSTELIQDFNNKFTTTNLAGRVAQQAQQLGNSSLANENYVNAAFKALHGRDATAAELKSFTGKGVSDVYNAIKAGSPTNKAVVDTIAEGAKPMPEKIGVGELPEKNIPDPTKYFQEGTGVENVPYMVDYTVSSIQNLITDLNNQIAQMANIDAADLINQTYNKFQLQEQINELADVNKEIASLKGSLDLGLISEGNRIAPLSVIGRRQQTLIDQSSARINALGSIAQAISGNIDASANLAQFGINTILGQKEKQIQNYKSLLSMADSRLINLKNQERADIQMKIEQEEADKNRLEREQDKMAALITTYPGAAKDAGITLADSYNDALIKMLPYISNYDENTGNWEMFTDEEGKTKIFDSKTGTIKSVDADVAEDQYFTDANGVSWNIKGWATDPTKVQQMQSISDRIGKLTDANLAEKVAQYAPGLTADMIRETSRRTGVSWEALLTMVNQEAVVGGQLSNVAQKNNNFGGLTWNNQSWVKAYGGKKGTPRPSTEGGNYISFPTKQEGLNAMGDLIASYGIVSLEEPVKEVSENVISLTKLVNEGNLTADQALKQIDEKDKKDLINSLAETKKPTTEVEEQEQALIGLADSLIDHKGMDTAVGPVWLARTTWASPTAMLDAFGNKDDFLSGIDQLMSSLSLESLIEAKSRGATFGALSDSEMRILSSAASKIGSRAIRDKNGRLTGFDMTEKAMKEELTKISEKLNKAKKNSINDNIKEMDDGLTWQYDPINKTYELIK